MFFAGIKKVPKGDLFLAPETKTYSPYGEYFPNIRAALSYVSRRWGVPFPKNQYGYTKRDLANIKIPKHVKA